MYFKVKNANGESSVVSDTITLKKALAATFSCRAKSLFALQEPEGQKAYSRGVKPLVKK